jgi:hypothetical protein
MGAAGRVMDPTKETIWEKRVTTPGREITAYPEVRTTAVQPVGGMARAVAVAKGVILLVKPVASSSKE